MIEDFIDYDALFPHVDVFVTNGGLRQRAGGDAARGAGGGGGQAEGKNDIAARIGYNRLGIDLRTERPKPARIREAVRQVLADATYAASVEAVRAELESYDPMARIDAVLRDEALTRQR